MKLKASARETFGCFFGQLVEKNRIELDLLQAELAEISGVSHRHLNGIESRGRQISLYTAVKLADVLGISLDDLKDDLHDFEAQHEKQSQAQ